MSLGATELCLEDMGGWTRLDDALRRARAAGLGEAASMALTRMVAYRSGSKDPLAALPLAQDALELATNLGLESSERFLRLVATDSLVDAGRLDEAVEAAKSLEAQTDPSDPFLLQPLAVLARVASRRGEPAARGMLDDLAARARRFDDRWLYTLVSLTLSEGGFLLGDLSSGRRGPTWDSTTWATRATSTGAASSRCSCCDVKGHATSTSGSARHIAGR